MKKPVLVQFGAGNIGRSFVGQLFARAGYEVVFVDVDIRLVDELNRRHGYTVEIHDDPPGKIRVRGVRAVDGRKQEAVVTALVQADVAATAVGPNALPFILPSLAAGLVARRGRPLELIIAENLRGAAQVIREGIEPFLPAGFPLDRQLGLVETSIGKMVPIMPQAVREQDPLLVYAEAYNTLILDRKGFLGPIPQVPGLDPKDNIAAYVDRKSFIHNLGHAAAAYVAYAHDPALVYLWQAMQVPAVSHLAARAMGESADALMYEYPGEWTRRELEEHISDLLRRFGNRALGDTIFRVGRDLPRKLSPSDRLVGALRLQQKHRVDSAATCTAIGLALRFRAVDEQGRLFPADEAFATRLKKVGEEAMLAEVSGIRANDPALPAILAAARTPK